MRIINDRGFLHVLYTMFFQLQQFGFYHSLDPTGLPCVVHWIGLVIVMARRRPNDYRRAPVEGEIPPVDPQQQRPQPRAAAAVEQHIIEDNPGIPLVPRAQPEAVFEEEDGNVERHPDVPFAPRPQPEAVPEEEERTVEGGLDVPLVRPDTQSDGFPDVAGEVRSMLSADRLSIRTQHEELCGLDGQPSAAYLLTGGSSS